MAGMWYENALFYGMDVRRFQDSDGDGIGDLRGLIRRLDYLKDLGVDALWMLPFFDTPLRDNGYDISDYYRVDPRAGSLEDFTALLEAAHRREMRVIVDLVMNHTSDQHPWFQAARRDPGSRYRNYYVWADHPPETPAGGGPIFPGEEDDVWRFDPLAQSHYFHRFYHFQPDLRIHNPQVQEEIFRAVDFWLSMGVDGFRFDAAPIMLEAKGLPETLMGDPHRLFQDLHSAIVARNPEAVLLGEANVQLDLMDEFFGGGSEMNMLFNFLLGPHILLALAEENAVPLRNYLTHLLVPPATDAWLNFLRNHDELSLEKMPPEQNEILYKAFAPDGSMRIYGRGIRRRIAPMLSSGREGIHRERVELAYSLLFSAPGAVMLMYGDEIGMGENPALPGRFPVRTPMQWSAGDNAGFSTAPAGRLIAPVIDRGGFAYAKVNVEDQQVDPGSFLHFVRGLIAARRTCPEVGICPVRLVDALETGDDHMVISAFPDIHDPRQTALLLFHNVSDRPHDATLPLEDGVRGPFRRLWGKGSFTETEKDGRPVLRADLPPYGYLWLKR